MLPERLLHAIVVFFLPSGSPFANVQGGISPRMARANYNGSARPTAIESRHGARGVTTALNNIDLHAHLA